MKHLIFLSLALLMCANSATAAELPLSGSCGNGCLYEITTNANGKKDLRVYNAPTYEGTAYIAEAAFAGKGINPSNDYEEYYTNASFDKITIDGNFDSIGSNAFWHNNATEIAFNGNVRVIGYRAFEYNNFTELKLPETLKTISNQAFYGNNLTSLVIPDSVTSVEHYAFHEDTTMQNVYMSDNLENLGTLYPFGSWQRPNIICKGDVEKCKSLVKGIKDYLADQPAGLDKYVVAATYEQCDGQYFWNGIGCVREPDVSKRACCPVCADLDGFCSRIRYTLPEADAATSDDNENMIEWIFE
ncbi:MAG: leucine-rich repeat domain-containing protein [Alphaproteobacteria bacterium]|nr:leucine-rich repeat domain-containing protein [Alphaproteobacteria bacterium]